MEDFLQLANSIYMSNDLQRPVVTSEEFCLPPKHRGDKVSHGLLVDGWPTYWSLDEIVSSYRNSNASLAARFGTRLDGKYNKIRIIDTMMISFLRNSNQ